MRALILNSGIGKRMGILSSQHPKCMTVIDKGETILSRQLKLLYQCGITEVIITTGPFEKVLMRRFLSSWSTCRRFKNLASSKAG